MSTEVGTCLINKWRAKIHQEKLYNVKVNAPKKGLGKMAENQSLPARLLEKDSKAKMTYPYMNTTKDSLPSD